MKLFSALFNLAKLPLVVAKDVITAPADFSTLGEPFRSTKELCKELDSNLEK